MNTLDNYKELLDNTSYVCFALDRDFKLVTKNKALDYITFALAQRTFEVNDLFLGDWFEDSVSNTFRDLFSEAFKGKVVEKLIMYKNDKRSWLFIPISENEVVNIVLAVAVSGINENAYAHNLSAMPILSDAVINSNSDPIYSIDRKFRFIAFNKSFSDFYKHHFGLDAKIGDTINSFGQKDKLSLKLNEKYSKALNGEPQTCDTVDGNEYYEKRFNPIRISNGEMIIGVSVHMFNVSDKRILEKEIARSKNRYEEIVNSVNDIIFQANNDGNWIFLNKSWQMKLGYNIEDSIGKPFFSFLHPDDVQANLDLFIPLINRKKEYCSHQTRYMTKQGGVRWMKVYAVLIEDEYGQIQGTSGTLTDITAEIEHFEKYKLLAENIHDSICLHNADGTFYYVSPSMKLLAGYAPEELEGKSPYDFIHPQDIDKVSEVHSSILQGEDAYLTTYRFRSKSGVYDWYETNNKLIRTENGEIKHLITSSRIVNDRMRAEENTMNALEERRRLNDQKAKFISMASHEFRTPITSIQMSTDIIDLKLRDLDIPHKKDIQKHIGIINKDVERFLSIMNDILTLGKTEKNILTVNKVPLSMLELVDECATKIKEISDEVREIKVSVLGDVREVQADKSQLEHIIENLLSNAFKFSKGKQAPELSLIYHKDRFVIQVRDYGIGIPDADQSHLFSSFYRASNTSSIRGTGLGLVIIKNLVRLHKGTIEIKSKENEGTEVTVLIKG